MQICRAKCDRLLCKVLAKYGRQTGSCGNDDTPMDKRIAQQDTLPLTWTAHLVHIKTDHSFSVSGHRNFFKHALDSTETHEMQCNQKAMHRNAKNMKMHTNIFLHEQKYRTRIRYLINRCGSGDLRFIYSMVFSIAQECVDALSLRQIARMIDNNA